MKNKIDRNSVVQRKQEVISSKVDDETVMMSIESSKYFGVNDTGSRIWEIIETPVSVSELISMMLAEYEIAPETCEDQVMMFLDHLTQEKILIIK